jgi:hypothetical protein
MICRKKDRIEKDRQGTENGFSGIVWWDLVNSKTVVASFMDVRFHDEIVPKIQRDEKELDG